MSRYQKSPDAPEEFVWGMDVKAAIKLGQIIHPDPNKLADSFRKHVRIFQKSELCKRVKLLLSKLFNEQKVNKIVAFGLGQISVPMSDPDSAKAVHIHSQHAALLEIREAWKESPQGRTGNFDIFVQDPTYSKQDADILFLKKWGITVVNAELGYQVGACLLDIYTLVVDFVCLWPVAHVVFETTRPAGIFKAVTIKTELEEKMYEEEAIFHYELEPPLGHQVYTSPAGGGWDDSRFLYFPGTGV